MYKLFFLSIASALLISCSEGQAQSGKTDLNVTEFSQQLAASKDATLLDVRTPGEYEKGHLDNALNIDYKNNNFMSEVEKLDKNKPIYVYCLSGGRSSGAVSKMQKAGFKEVYNMEGGIMQWRANNMPETTSSTKKTASDEMTLQDYEKALATDKAVLVDFYAEWCAPCKKMEPYMKKIEEENKDKMSLLRIDVDKNQSLTKTLNIDAVPVLRIYKNGKSVWEAKGLVEEKDLRAELQKHQ